MNFKKLVLMATILCLGYHNNARAADFLESLIKKHNPSQCPDLTGIYSANGANLVFTSESIENGISFDSANSMNNGPSNIDGTITDLTELPPSVNIGGVSNFRARFAGICQKNSTTMGFDINMTLADPTSGQPMNMHTLTKVTLVKNPKTKDVLATVSMTIFEPKKIGPKAMKAKLKYVGENPQN
jgi:hypothetical protein